MKPYLKEYYAHRKYQWKWGGGGKDCRRAAYALEHAKTKWFFDLLEEHVYVSIDPDNFSTVKDLMGDCYDPRVNPDFAPHVLKRQEERELKRIEEDGAWCLTLMVNRDEDCAESIDSTGGFIGDDWKYSGYDLDMYREGVRHVLANRGGGVDVGWAVGTGWQQFGKMSSVEAWLAFQDVLSKTTVLNLENIHRILRDNKGTGVLAVHESDYCRLVWLPSSLHLGVPSAPTEFFFGAVEYELERRKNEATRTDQETV
jgi:hypothetical protein